MTVLLQSRRLIIAYALLGLLSFLITDCVSGSFVVEERDALTDSRLLTAPKACEIGNVSKKKCRKICNKNIPKGCKKKCKKCFKLGSGEKECEGNGFTKKQCLKVGCCNWTNNKCASAVGNNACDSFTEKYGGCHIPIECKTCVKSKLKFISPNPKPLTSAGNNISSMMAYGLRLVGISTEDYTRWCWVVKAITEILSDNVKDLNLQSKVIEHLYKRKVVAMITEGKPLQFSDSFEDSHSKCDGLGVKIETENPSDQIGEVLEHLLHFIHVGERYTFPQWSTISELSTDAWEAVSEAVDAGVYDISDYNNIGNKEDRRRIILQEFHFWLVFADWNLLEDGVFNLGFGEWQGVKNLKEMKNKLPKTHKLYMKTTRKVLSKPAIETLHSLGTLMEGSTPDTCVMPTS